MKIFYTTRATATGGRSGHTALDDGSLAFDLVVPGSGKSGANPEQLFALGYAACFDSAISVGRILESDVWPAAKAMCVPCSANKCRIQESDLRVRAS